MNHGERLLTYEFTIIQYVNNPQRYGQTNSNFSISGKKRKKYYKAWNMTNVISKSYTFTSYHTRFFTSL